MTLFADLARLLETLAGEASRLKKRAALAEALVVAQAAGNARAAEDSDAGLLALYAAGTPFAEADARKLNAGGALLTRAVLVVSGATEAELTAAYRRHGDLGATAFDLWEGHAPVARHAAAAKLTLSDVATAFAAMATARTTAVRAGLVEGLLRRAGALEAKYLLKLMLGDLRIGVKQSLVEDAIAAAAEVPIAVVRHAVMLEADLGQAVRRAFAGTLAEARMRLFHPLGFMLASPVEAAEEAVERFMKGAASSTKGEKTPKGEEAPPREGEEAEAVIEAFLEDKYDGMRAQVHCGDAEQPGRVAIYSRNREDVTESFPELAEAFARVRAEDGGPFLFDGEILGWDFGGVGADLGVTEGSVPEGSVPGGVPGEQAGRALPFAVLGQRIGRKRVSNEWRARVPVVFMAFDLLCADGELLLGLPLRERRNRLEAVVEQLLGRVVSSIETDPRRDGVQSDLFADRPIDGSTAAEACASRLLLAPSRLVESAEDIDRAYAAARARANEGVMLKAAGSVYQPGRRGLAWVKLKRELATLDVVITGAEYGHGKRAGLLSDYTFAVRGPGSARTGSLPGGPPDGLPSDLLNVGKAYSGVTDAEITELTEFLKTHTLVDYGHFRTVEPLVVLEVAFNNVMRSERHASGFALRFPRIVRLRPDKPVSEIDTVERVEAIYQSQVDKPLEGEP